MSMQPPPPPPGMPPPPGAGGWQPAPSGPAPFSVGDAVSYGWSAYWKNAGTLIVIALVVIAIDVVFNIIGSSINSSFGSVLFSLLGWLLGLLISLGWFRVSLEITRGQRPEIGDLFKAQGYGPYVGASILFALGFWIGIVLLIVPGIIFALTFGFYHFVIAERGDSVGVMDALRRSAELTRGHRWELVMTAGYGTPVGEDACADQDGRPHRQRDEYTEHVVEPHVLQAPSALVVDVVVAIRQERAQHAAVEAQRAHP